MYLSYSPERPLADFVDSLWYLSDAPSHARERVLPSGTFELVINLREDEFRIYDPSDMDRCERLRGAIVSGAYRRHFIIDTREHASVMGVHFKAGCAFPFTVASPDGIGGAHVELQDLWGPRAPELRDRVCTATTTTERFQILEGELTRCLRARISPRPGVQVALRLLDRPGTSVRDVAAHLGLSRRRLAELFEAEVGMTPKLFGRIRRFQRALARARRSASPEWGALALAAGYYDHSHLIREFGEFSGLSPVELVASSAKPVKENHVAVDVRFRGPR